MTDPTTPNPAHVQRGAVALTTALRISTLLPCEQDAIFSILRTLNTADELMPHLAAQPGSDAYGMRLLAAIADNDRRELANLGGTRWSPEPRPPARTTPRRLRPAILR